MTHSSVIVACIVKGEVTNLNSDSNVINKTSAGKEMNDSMFL